MQFIKRSLVTISAALCVMLVFCLIGHIPVQADEDEIYWDLILDDGGVVPWQFNNVKPGDSGVITASLHNASTHRGFISIWIDNITDLEGENPEAETGDTEEPGELSKFIILNITGENIAPYTILLDPPFPLGLNAFPQNVNYPLSLDDKPIESDDSIEIQWQWTIPPQTTNVIQGDSVSFDIHYILTTTPIILRPLKFGPTGGGGGRDLDTDDSDTQDDTVVEDSIDSDTQTVKDAGTTTTSDNDRTYHSRDGKLTVIVPAGTTVTSGLKEELYYVGISIDSLITDLPEGSVPLTPVYYISSYTIEEHYIDAELDRLVTVIIKYDKDRLPEEFDSIYAARYTEDSGWVKLTGIMEIDYETGTITLVTKRLSSVAIFAETSVPDDSVEVISSPTDDTPKPASQDSQSETNLINLSSTPSTSTLVILRYVSLIVAISGLLAMIVLAYLTRKKRAGRRTVKS